MKSNKLKFEESSSPKVEINSFKDYDELYQSIPEEGSLGILALGARGLLLWRKKRSEIEEKRKSKQGK